MGSCGPGMNGCGQGMGTMPKGLVPGEGEERDGAGAEAHLAEYLLWRDLIFFLLESCHNVRCTPIDSREKRCLLKFLFTRHVPNIAIFLLGDLHKRCSVFSAPALGRPLSADEHHAGGRLPTLS